jgi:hypothetical protein
MVGSQGGLVRKVILNYDKGRETWVITVVGANNTPPISSWLQQVCRTTSPDQPGMVVNAIREMHPDIDSIEILFPRT